jgi:uncharacterized RDD family membrane protein YckC
VGKLILGMRVVKEDGTPCGLGAAFHRGIWRFIDAIILGAIAYSNMKPPLQQRLGDKKAHTLVVAKNDPIVKHTHEWLWFVLAALIYVGLDVLVSALLLGLQLR